MASGPRFRVAFRRRRTGKTNYHLRRKLVRSGNPRLVARFSNKHSLAQIVESANEGDKTISASHSKELSSYGWKANTGNLSAAYLTGFLLGNKVKKNNLDTVILDIGLAVPVYGSRVFSLLKGVIDAGVDIPHSDSVFPPEDRIKGEHIVSYAKKLKEEEEEEAYKARFSGYISRKVKPEDIPKHFDEVVKNIRKKFQ